VNIRFVPEAAKDLDDAVEWYEAERKGLGKRFARIVDESILRIARYPIFASEVKPNIYRSLVKRFPYSIYYALDSDGILIYAIAHLHRKPLYWSSRIG
jgi:plasmid stabilization system protein ParE